jgi:hypothetical protein
VALTQEQECLDTLDRRKPFTVRLKMVHLSIYLCTPTKQIKVLSGEPVLSYPLSSLSITGQTRDSTARTSIRYSTVNKVSRVRLGLERPYKACQSATFSALFTWPDFRASMTGICLPGNAFGAEASELLY